MYSPLQKPFPYRASANKVAKEIVFWMVSAISFYWNGNCEVSHFV